MSFINKIMGVVKIAAPIAANIVLPGSGSIVGGLMNGVLKDAGHAVDGMNQETKAKMIAENPELLKALETKAMDLEAEISKQRTENMGQVAGTMQEELRHGNWWQKGWRPWNGYLFPVAVLGAYVVVPILKATLALKYPMLALIDIQIPATLWVIWGGVLGVAVYGRNQEKAPQANAGGVVKGLINKFIK